MILRCKVLPATDSSVTFHLPNKQPIQSIWFAVQLEEKGVITPVPESVPVAVKLMDGRIMDLREHAPFYQMLPCPWCGVEEDKNHGSKSHIFPDNHAFL